jgi:hypothetical protein
MTTDYEGPWELACSETDFLRWRDESGFRALVTLARAVNAIRFAGYALYPVSTADSPAASRQRLNSFMYVGALLYEAALFLRKYRADLTPYVSFGPLAQTMLDDPDATQFIDDKLHQLRNRAVFHFDPRFVPRTLGDAEGGFFIFGRGATFKAGETYYDMADRSALNSLVGGVPSDAEFRERIKDLIVRTTALMKGFLDGADALIAGTLTDPDWRVRAKEL